MGGMRQEVERDAGRIRIIVVNQQDHVGAEARSTHANGE
ncbi:hypothetical protein Z949_1128 [Sulfitobacter guttiformis KCTC 32187]|uniref:Uncharacterized protein n=1 Tax=Sulfitobacter guttiformis TaxID=74349 RepID=A0A420DJ45_9RHOB|nr:hypothetical protein Z949_1128 [Sulfitobacter guttiformis KCTC 32187]RKE94239.1 hypothetical protein C8N30_3357 [Sulfitobacter guttiformis]